MFTVRAQGDVRLLMRFNGGSEHDIDFSFDSSETEPFRSFHEVLPGSNVQAADNELFILVSGPGSIQMSDVVLLYHAKTS
jgi:hypothetical protein